MRYYLDHVSIGIELVYACFLRYAWILIFLNAGSVCAQKSIDTTYTIRVGGIEQYVRIMGKDVTKPLFLFLHGGPGGSVMGYAHKFTSRLQQHFVVVQWDQRETGKTLQLNSSPVPLTLQLFQSDTKVLVDSLLKQFNRKKLYLAGHSWGTVLGFALAKEFPEYIYAYLAISPVIHQVESERIILKLMKDSARKSSDSIQIRELSKIQIPFKTGEDLYYHRKWLFKFNGQKVSEKTFSKKFAFSWSARWLSVWNEASAINHIESLPVVKCPVYFFVGRNDFQTNYGIAEKYYSILVSPKKQLFWFEGTGHSIPASKPALLQDIIISTVLKKTFHQ
jgi:pimeloyl-ACP methyl ester carboxylesterase